MGLLPSLLALLLSGAPAHSGAPSQKSSHTNSLHTLSDPAIVRSGMTIDDIAWMDKAESVLLGAPIEYVAYDPKTRTTNEAELIYQHLVAKNKQMPVVLLVYTNVVEKNEDPFATLRQAYNFRQLAIELRGKIKFVAYDANVNPNKDENDLGEELGLDGYPSVLLFGPRDYTSDKDPELGKIHILDILSGGPADNSQASMVRQNMAKWILTNTQGPKKNVIIRFYNSGHYHETPIKQTQ